MQTLESVCIFLELLDPFPLRKMSSFATVRPGWQVKRLETQIGKLGPRGGSSVCSTAVGLIIFGGANREQVAFDDFVVCSIEERSKTGASKDGKAKEAKGASKDGKDSKESKDLLWKKIVTSGDTPQPRSGHACVSYGNFMFLFGGIDFKEETVYSDLYVLNLVTWAWRYVGETGAEIEGRNSHSLGIISVPVAAASVTPSNVSDGPASDGGDGSSLGDEAEQGSTSGSAVGATGSSSSGAIGSRAGTTSSGGEVEVAHKQYLVVFGGASEKGPLGDTFLAPLPTADRVAELDTDDVYVHWTALKQYTPLPEAREMHGTAMSLQDGRDGAHGSSSGATSMFISGGRGVDTLFGDVWELTCNNAAAAAADAGIGAGISSTAATVVKTAEASTAAAASAVASPVTFLLAAASSAPAPAAPVIVDITEAMGSDSMATDVAPARKRAPPKPSAAAAAASALKDMQKEKEKEAVQVDVKQEQEDVSELLQWRLREDLQLAYPRCAHGSTVINAGVGVGESSGDGAGDVKLHKNHSANNSTHILTMIGGFQGQHIAEDVTSIPLNKSDKEWKSVKCGSAIGKRFGTAVCTSPEWLLDRKFPDGKSSSVNSGAMLVYGGINMEAEFGDLLLLLPPTIANATE